jgi:mannose-6-phosphate isomerase-like protein (cupin superfamily)
VTGAAVFPGGTSVTMLEVYADAAPDGIRGGSPHLHLVSTESYVVVEGQGALQTIDPTGYRETPLSPGAVVWFTPGTIHRAVNLGGLRVLVVMSNAGLPEAGDAVMTFPREIVADPARYAEAALLPLGGESERAPAAARRRDLAVTGFLALRDRILAGDAAALDEFYADAARIVAARAAAWEGIVRSGPLRDAEAALAMASAVADGSVVHLEGAGVHRAQASAGDLGFGMCGRLRTYDVGDGYADADVEHT